MPLHSFADLSGDLLEQISKLKEELDALAQAREKVGYPVECLKLSTASLVHHVYNNPLYM